MLCTIIGAGSGLGAALAWRFASGGYRTALIARNPETTAPIVNRLKEGGHDARGFTGDASSEASLDNAFDEIRKWGRATDVLIYNASAMIAGKASDLTPQRVQSEMATNLGGAIVSVRNTLPAMRTRGAGTIIFTGGGLALEPYPEWASLAAGKAALRAYSISLYKEVAHEGVHVAAIAVCGIVDPGGPFDPDLIADRYWQTHMEPPGSFSREVVYLPEGADPYYNDRAGAYRPLSRPIVSCEGAA